MHLPARTASIVGALLLPSALVLATASPAAAASAPSPVEVPVGDAPIAVVFSPDGAWAYVANETGNTVSVVDTGSQTVTATVPVGSTPYALAISPDGGLLYVADYGSSAVSVIDTTTDLVTATIATGANPGGLAVSPDGATLYVSTFGASVVTAYDTATDSQGAVQAVGGGPFPVIASDTAVATANLNGNSVTCLEPDLSGPIGTASVPGMPQGLAVSPDGRTAAAVSTMTRTVSIIDLSDCSVSASYGVGHSPVGVTFTTDGSRVFVANGGDATISVLDLASGTVTTTTVLSGPLGLDVSADGSTLAVAGQGSNVLGLYALPTVSAPAAVSVTAGQTAAFTVTITGSPDAVTWQRSDDGGTTWTDVVGASGDTYAFTATSTDDGARFRAVATSTAWGTATSAPAALTVTTPSAPELAATGSEPFLPLALAILLLAVGLIAAATARRRTRKG